jgi:hypothetical protein
MTISQRSPQSPSFHRNVRELAQDVASLRADIKQYRTDLRQVLECLLIEYGPRREAPQLPKTTSSSQAQTPS